MSRVAVSAQHVTVLSRLCHLTPIPPFRLSAVRFRLSAFPLRTGRRSSILTVPFGLSRSTGDVLLLSYCLIHIHHIVPHSAFGVLSRLDLSHPITPSD